MNALPVEPIAEVDLLFFQAGEQLFGVDPLEVLRIDRFNDTIAHCSVRPTASGRVLVSRAAGREFQLPVDRVLGVRRFARTALRRAPPLVFTLGGPRADEVMGVCIDGEAAVLLLDLQVLSRRAIAPRALDETPDEGT
jgi:hypothetical protein